MKRLRVFDLNTPWFWLTVFYRRRYGQPWLVLTLWPPVPFGTRRWWCHAWRWENEPLTEGAYDAVPEATP